MQLNESNKHRWVISASTLNAVFCLIVIFIAAIIGGLPAKAYAWIVPAFHILQEEDEDEADKKTAEQKLEEQEEQRHKEIKKAEAKAELLIQRDQTQLRTKWHNAGCMAGNRQCIDCHEQEVRAWKKSKHATRAFDLLRTSESALEYAKKLDIRPIDITRSALCINCHGTQETKHNGRVTVFAGVSCESCHGQSLGEQGWLNAHGVYGAAHTLREHETYEHYSQRQLRIENAGLRRSSNLYAMTKRCYDCHVLGDEALSKAGHAHGEGFEMVAKSLGEVRHNFALNEHVNEKAASLWLDPFRHGQGRSVTGRLRVMFLLGQMVDLEVSLRNLARASEENDFSDAMCSRIEDAYELLAEDVVEEIDEMDEEKAEEAGNSSILDRPEFTEIKAVIAVVEPIWEKLDDDGFNKEEASLYIQAADAIAIEAIRFGKRNGNQLGAIDELELLPEDYFDGAYDPRFPDGKPQGLESETE